VHSIPAVDDAAPVRPMVSFTLKNAGFDVVEAVEAVDGQDAIGKASGRGFSLALTERNMPRMDGNSPTNKLREDPKCRTTPILILTTESSDRMTAQRGDARRRTSRTTRSTRS
jgi:two-component system chemotaxis response regulator CheY